MPQVPIACSLTADDASERVDEWQAFLSQQVVDVQSVDGRAVLRLQAGPEALLAAIDLAQREKACCAFFEFRLEIGTDVVSLVVEAPEEAAPLVARLVLRAQR